MQTSARTLSKEAEATGEKRAQAVYKSASTRPYAHSTSIIHNTRNASSARSARNTRSARRACSAPSAHSGAAGARGNAESFAR
eukprot:3731905-Pleurochrysis_carterae.AAC.1